MALVLGLWGSPWSAPPARTRGPVGLRPLAKGSRIARGARVAVIGAGPVGLAAAVALRRRGLSDITVYERAPKLAPLGTAWRPRPAPRPNVGGGVQLHSGAALLGDLGVDLSFAQPMRRLKSRATDGEVLLSLDLPTLMAGMPVVWGSALRTASRPS